MNLNDTIYARAHRLTLEKGGGTFSPNDLEPLQEGWPVYILSLDDDRGVEMPLDEFTVTRFTLFVENNRAFINKFNALDGAEEGHKEIGTWVHDGKVYLDVVTLLPVYSYDREDVNLIARKHQQRAYYDMLNGETVWV